MIHVEVNTDGSYTVKLDAPEQILLRKISKAYAIPMRESMGSVVLRGMESIGKLILNADKQPEGRDGSGDFR